MQERRDNRLNNEIVQLEIDARKLVEGYAASSPYKLNPDSKHVEKIIKALAKKKLKNGFFYCPCRMLSENRELDAKIVCPCDYHVEEIERDGLCSCDLFVSPGYKPVSAAAY